MKPRSHGAINALRDQLAKAAAERDTHVKSMKDWVEAYQRYRAMLSKLSAAQIQTYARTHSPNEITGENDA